MLQLYKTAVNKLYTIIASGTFFIGTLILFALQAAWIALSSNLLPYDEYYHIGIIRFYANQWSPFIANQPAEMSLYGDVTRLPSYLYHYLMSFPYRALSSVIQNEEILMILLRFLNIAMIIGGIILFRRLFMRAGISRRILHFAVALFVLLPMTPLLAAQNNYDNLMFLLTPLFFAAAYTLVKNGPTIFGIFAFTTIGMLTTLVKHNFMVVLLAAGFFVLFHIVWNHRAAFWPNLKKDYKNLNKGILALMAVFFMLVAGLFIERHAVNVLRYRQIKVDCAKVQPVTVCEQNSPWLRNRSALERNLKHHGLYGNPASFTIHWVSTMVRGHIAVFANIVPDNLSQPNPFGRYVFKPVMPLMLVALYGIILAGILAAVLRFKMIWQNKLLQMLLITAAALTAVLWIFNYTFYLKYGRAYGVQARYLLPVILPMLVITTVGMRDLVKNRVLKQSLAISILLLFLYSGGVSGWIIRSEPDWYIQNGTIIQINQTAQTFLKKIVIH